MQPKFDPHLPTIELVEYCVNQVSEAQVRALRDAAQKRLDRAHPRSLNRLRRLELLNENNIITHLGVEVLRHYHSRLCRELFGPRNPLPTKKEAENCPVRTEMRLRRNGYSTPCQQTGTPCSCSSHWRSSWSSGG